MGNDDFKYIFQIYVSKIYACLWKHWGDFKRGREYKSKSQWVESLLQASMESKFD